MYTDNMAYIYLHKYKIENLLVQIPNEELKIVIFCFIHTRIKYFDFIETHFFIHYFFYLIIIINKR